MSGYSWVTNNPIRYSDILGLDSAQRNAGIQMASEFVSKNTNQSSASYGTNSNPQPGESCNCSGLIKAAVMAGGESNPNIGINDCGTQTIVENTEVVQGVSSLQEGNLIFFNTVKERENSHVGMVSTINRDENGSPISVRFIHSGTSTGPVPATATLDGSDYWGGRLSSTPFRKWDTIPDKKVTYSGGTLPTHIVNGSGISLHRPKIF